LREGRHAAADLSESARRGIVHQFGRTALYLAGKYPGAVEHNVPGDPDAWSLYLYNRRDAGLVTVEAPSLDQAPMRASVALVSLTTEPGAKAYHTYVLTGDGETLERFDINKQTIADPNPDAGRVVVTGEEVVGLHAHMLRQTGDGLYLPVTSAVAKELQGAGLR
jgi:hypothetical protein